MGLRVRYLVLTTVMALSALLAAAANVGAAPCAVASMTIYDAPGFSCTIDDKTFSAFEYSAAGTDPVAAALVTVIPVSDLINGQGFTFQAPWSLTGVNLSSDSLITFDVANSTGAATIKDASIALFSGSFITGDGQAIITEGLCLGGIPCPGGVTGVMNSANAANQFPLPAGVLFTPTGVVHASKDILVKTGSAGGSVTLTSVTDQFSQVAVAEPGTLLLLGIGFLGAGMFGRKRLGTRQA